MQLTMLLSSILLLLTEIGGGNVDKCNFMIGSPSVMVSHLHGIGLMLDNRVCVGCGGMTSVPPGHGTPVDAGGGGEVAGRLVTNMGQEHRVVG